MEFTVEFKTVVYGTATVEAESETEAREQVEGMTLTSYCGNGGFDKLVGVDDDRISLEVGCGGGFEVEDVCKK
jgi:hypothetical protein